MRSVNRSILLVLLLILVSFPVNIAQSDESAAIDTILDQMTLEHKVGQMFLVNLYGSQLTNAGREMLETWQPGAVLLMDSNIRSPSQLVVLINSYQQTITDAGGIPLFVTTDQEGGVIQRLREGFTTWPVPMLLTATNDPELAFKVGLGMAREMAAVGFNMNLAPVADLQTNLANPIIGRRSFGSDPEQVGLTINGLVRGMQDGGVMTTLKHFPGHGDTNEDSHVTLPTIHHDLQRLLSVELPPFVAGMDAGSGAVMVSHIWFSSFDSEEPIPASLSHSVVTGLLRDTLSYDGIIMTDALDMDAIDTRYSPETASVMAVEAGIDLIAIGANAGEAIQARAMQAVVDTVREGRIDESRINDSVRRILIAKQRFGVLEWSPADPATVTDRMEVEANSRLITEVFQKGVTLAFDRHNILPFDDSSSVAIIYPGTRNQIMRECSEYSQNIRWLSVSDFPQESEIDIARNLPGFVDHVVVFIQNAYDAFPRQALVNALPADKTVVVALQSPYDVLRFPNIGAYIVTYSPLEPAVPAACDILFGAIPALGSLSVQLTDVR